MKNTWQAAEARHRFTELVDAAVQGDPQFVRRRDGREVVVVSRQFFDQNRATLQSYLLTQGVSGDAEDAFDLAMRDIRTKGSPWLTARQVKAGE